jgi:hypothetical protein
MRLVGRAHCPVSQADFESVGCRFDPCWARWRIENSGFRELKAGWNLERAPWSWRHENVVRGRVTFTLIAFNVAQVAKTRRGQHLRNRGIRRLRRELGTTYGVAPVVVFTTAHFGLFHIEEIMALAGRPPRHSLWHPPPLS